MAIAINNSYLALDVLPRVQEELDHAEGGGRRFQIHRVCAFATILSFDFELWRQMQLETPSHFKLCAERCMAKKEALDWQADPDDDLGELEVLHHLCQQAAVVPFLSGVISRRDHSNGATILSGSALSPSIQAKTQGRLLPSFHRHSIRRSYLELEHPQPDPNSRDGGAFLVGVGRRTSMTPVFLHFPLDELIVWASSQADGHVVFWQVQLDVIDLFSRRTLPTSSPGKQWRTAFNPFLQVSHSPVVEDTCRGNPLLHTRRFNGVRHRPDRKIWVAEMKLPKHMNKQDFGNFKSEAEAAHAVDAAFHHYGKSHLLNFPDTSLQFFFTRPRALPGLDEKAKVKFVKEEAKLLLAAIAATSPLHSTPTHSLQILELSGSPRRCPSGQFRSLSEISSPFSCSGPDEADAAVSQPEQWVDLDSIWDISTTGGQNNLETLNSVQNTELGWDGAQASSTLAAPLNVANLSAYKNQSIWRDPLIRSPPALTSSRSPSPSHFQEGIAYALLQQQSI